MNTLYSQFFLGLFSLLTLGSCAQESQPSKSGKFVDMTDEAQLAKLETITLGAGCFWCVEAVFQELKGVGDIRIHRR